MTCDDVRDLAPGYVLGALEADEERLVAEHLETCQEDHSEVSELGSVVPYLEETVTLVEPPAALRQRILAAAAGDLANRARETQTEDREPVAIGSIPRAAVRPGRMTDGRAQGGVTSLDDARGRRLIDVGSWAIGIAAVLAIAVLGGLYVTQQQQLAAAREFQARTTEALRLASQPGAQVAVLMSATGASGGPTGIAVMPATGSGRLVMSGLPATTGGRVYEAWAIAEGSPPAPVGSFTVGQDGIGYFDRMPSASGENVTVAITLESRPDPPAPTTPVISSGVTVPATGAAS
jgi:anti-sigma factor RsiW